MRGSAGVLALVPLLAAAAPAPFAVTATQRSHRGGLGIGAGPSGWAIAWEEIAPTGADDRPRTIHAALVDGSGKVTAVATPLWSARTGPSEELVAWNGSSFTVVVCSDAWNGKQEILWGELTAAGAFTPKGEQPFDRGPLYCAQALAAGDHVEVIVASDNTTYGADDRILGRTCSTYRVAIRGDQATLGKAVPLCTSDAAGASWIVGDNAKDKLVIADAKGKTAAPSFAVQPNAVFAGASGPLFIVPHDDNRGADLVRVDPRTKKRTKRVGMERAVGVDPGAYAQGAALPGDGVVLVSTGASDIGLAIYGADGTLRASGPTWPKSRGTPQACGARTGALLCAWYQDDRASEAGEVYAIVVPLP